MDTETMFTRMAEANGFMCDRPYFVLRIARQNRRRIDHLFSDFELIDYCTRVSLKRHKTKAAAARLDINFAIIGGDRNRMMRYIMGSLECSIERDLHPHGA